MADSRALQVWNAALLMGLCVLSALSALMGALYLPLWLGGQPFPVTAFLCGALNVVVARVATWAWPRAGLAPLLVWLVVCLLCLLPGPGGSRILLLAIADWRAPFFLAMGTLPVIADRRFFGRE